MTEEPAPPAPIVLSEPTPIWYCKIGTRQPGVTLPHPADPPMRAAVEKAFREITGVDAEFTFSGWSAQLDEGEAMVLGGYPHEGSDQ